MTPEQREKIKKMMKLTREQHDKIAGYAVMISLAFLAFVAILKIIKS
jgi:hypothetical protein